MKRLIFGIVAVIIISIVVIAIPKSTFGKDEDKQNDEKNVENIDSSNGFYIETLSDKDIYFKADTTLPDIPVVNDMLDMANGYAIMRAVYCDAE